MMCDLVAAQRGSEEAAKMADALTAIGAVCSHAGGPLDEGAFDGHCVECPWHQSVFDLRDGGVVHGPATYPEPAYDVRVQGGQIEVRPRPSGMGQ